MKTTNKPKIVKQSNRKDFVADVESTTDLLQVLHQDHRKVSELFFQFTQKENSKDKKGLVTRLINELTWHAKAEEDLVYPLVRNGEKVVEDLMDEADTEHHVVKFLLTELGDMSPRDKHYDSKVTVLCELVKHHVEEEEKEMFEQIKLLKLDLEALGKQFLERKEALALKPMAEEKFPVPSSKAPRKKAA